MRAKRKGEDLGPYDKVQVTLADGRQIEMHMTPSQVMVMDSLDVEPILPMSALTERLGYSLHWRKGALEILRPEKDPLKVRMLNGCPQIPRTTTLHLIGQLEKGLEIKKAEVRLEEEQWLRGLVDAHPALRTLPEIVKQQLLVRPAENLRQLPGCNRRRRRVMEQDGFVVHLYAGRDEGYTLSRAFQEVGGDKRRLLEIDVERQGDGDRSHDMLAGEGPYASLLRAALDGNLKGVVMGPNCRTRSVLRHYPLNVPGGGPRPVRSWEEPWGMSRNTVEEQKKVTEDDVLMWRGWMIYILAEEVRRALGDPRSEKVWVGLEQPADPTHYMPEVVTFWKTPEWNRLKQRYGFEEQTFSQSRWGGPAVKPTTFAGNLKLEVPGDPVPADVDGCDERVQSSKDLSRWAPGFMKEVAQKIQTRVMQRSVKAVKMSWEEHVQRGHTPFRRDCQVCQEAAARDRPHFPAGCARAGVLNLDVAGPFIGGHDVEEKNKKRFMLIGTYTWLLPGREGGDDVDLPFEGVGDEELGPEIADPNGPPEGDLPAEVEDGLADHDEHPHLPEDRREGEEVKVEPRVEVLRVGLPISGKSQEAVMEGIIELYLQLRVDGFPIHTIHSDRGREFTNQKLRSWMRSRSIMQSTNGGEDPKANGRVEKAVGEVKRHIRRLLHAAELGAEWWPMAMRFAMESARMKRKGYEKKIPAFGQKVLVKKRSWRTKVLEATHEEARYLAPLVEFHGHCILRENGRWNVAPYVIQEIQQPPPPTEQMWLALADDADRDEVEERRRLRGKQPIRNGDAMKLRTVRLMIQEEAVGMDIHEPDVATMIFKKISPWKQALRKVEAEEEILQTKVVGVQEMLKELPLWDSAIKSEMESLFEKKGALREVEQDEVNAIRMKHPELRSLPAKLVITRKAGGKRKIRIVVCGNYAEKSPEEELYAGGSDSISMRTALRMAVQEGWCGVTVDVRTAFLNAPLPGGEDVDGTLVLITPPRLLVKLGYVSSSVQWMAVKAMYGLRQSPRAWGDFRDATLAKMTWQVEDDLIAFQPLVSDPNVWRIVKVTDDLEQTTLGLMLVYVDDLMLLGKLRLLQEALERVKREWELSPPEWLNSEHPVRFLGVDVWLTDKGIFLNQESYIKDLFKRNDEDEKLTSGVPISKEQTTELEVDDPQKSPEDVRLAQRATGELMWLATKTRPDLMFVMSRMSQATLRNPKEVVKVGVQVRRYLRKTLAHGLWIRPADEMTLEVFTDSSYGPGGQDSQGAVVVMWGGSVMMWKAGRQGTPSLSTAESELSEAIEGLSMGDAVEVMTQEIWGRPYAKVLKVDNQAAISILTDPSGSWRTRHLRLRASHVRWRLGRMDWLTEAAPGLDQLADGGTKVFTAPKLTDMREKLGMGVMKKAELGIEEPGEKSALSEKKVVHESEIQVALKMIQAAVLVSAMNPVGAQGEGDRETGGFDHGFAVVMFFALVGFLTVMIGVIWGLGIILGVRVALRRGDRQPEAIHEERGEKHTETDETIEQREETTLRSAEKGEDPHVSEDDGCERKAKSVDELEAMSQENPEELQRILMSMLHIEGSGSGLRQRSSEHRPEALRRPERTTGERRLRPVCLTYWGSCWHASTGCPTLAQTYPKVLSEFCPVCVSGHQTNGTLYAVGPGSTVHTDPRCEMRQSELDPYLACKRCTRP